MNTILLLIMLFDRTNITLTSTAFKDQGDIPREYTCEGKNINPPLTIGELPKGTKTLALIVDDPDAPKKLVTHWVAWNIPPGTTMIAQNSAAGTQGKNERGENKYMGPCPPSGKHHYYFKVYALDTSLNLSTDASRIELENAMDGHILGAGQLVGLYQKK